MVAWEELVAEELARFREDTGNDRVELSEVYDYTLERAAQEFPNNQHPEAKARQTLQWLRDDDKVEFLGDDVYRITEELERRPDERSRVDELEPEFQDLDSSGEGRES